MIPANELRIGNWVDTPNGRVLLTMVSEEHHKAGTFGEFNFSLSKLEPILLTPEILEKCGFKNKPHSSHKMFWHKGNLTFRLRGDWLELEISKSHHVFLYHLHQLQNLYFALTGEELKIQL